MEDLLRTGGHTRTMIGRDQAKEDFERYLQLAPDAEDASAVREQLIELAKQVVLIH